MVQTPYWQHDFRGTLAGTNSAMGQLLTSILCHLLHEWILNLFVPLQTGKFSWQILRPRTYL